MASELGYGQPMGGVAQTAFIVPDLQLAIRRWVSDMRAGPFFVLPNFLVPARPTAARNRAPTSPSRWALPGTC
jgi:hypothetical protein